MDATFKKMNFKSEPEVLVLQAPQSFQANMQAMEGLTTFKTSLDDAGPLRFCIAFVTMQEEVDRFAEAIAPRMEGDAALWFCYPKGTSKKYTCNFNRDTGWAALGRLGWEPVRQVAVDEDWSALRFRKVEFIKTITRRESFAITDDAKQRTSGKGK